MQNVKYSVKGNKLTIEVDISKDYGESASGKTVRVASTLGNKKIETEKYGDIMIGINVYKYPEDGEGPKKSKKKTKKDIEEDDDE